MTKAKPLKQVKSKETEGASEQTDLVGIPVATYMVVGIILIASAKVLTFGYATLKYRVPQGATVPSEYAIGLVFLGLLVNAVVKFCSKGRLQLSKRTLIILYVAGALGGLLWNVSLVGGLVVALTALRPLYYEWGPGFAFDVLFEKASPAVIIKDTKAIESFWAGGSSTPWNVWFLPIVTWTLFFTVMVFVWMCLATLVRKRWTDKEKFEYPLNLPVLMMVGVEKDINNAGDYNGFWRNRLTYVGALFALLVSGLNGLQEYFPALPRIAQRINLYSLLDGPVGES